MALLFTSSTTFLSTPSARRATPVFGPRFTPLVYFYPRPPRGGRLQDYQDSRGAMLISIHALREEGDPGCFSERKGDFNISIHALREEGDLTIQPPGVSH